MDDPRALAMALDGLDVEGTYVILADDVLVNERHLASAVTMAGRRWERGRAVGRTLGAEVMRCLAGSHHIGEAIRTVGLQPAPAEDGWSVWGSVKAPLKACCPALVSPHAHPTR